MAEWQQYLQTVFFGVVFSFLLAKLFSVIFAFHDDNLRLTRSGQTVSESESESEFEGKSPGSPLLGGIGNEGLVKESSVISDHSCSDSDDDWEGVESTELDRKFSAATAFVAEIAADRAAKKLSQLQLYGLYKIATEGPCSSPQPSALKMTARPKWQAWQKLGAMTPEEAMQKYIDIVTELYPSWDAGSRIKKKEQERGDAHVERSKGPMGPVFSTLTHEEEPGCQLKLDAIHTFAKEGDEEKLLECIESGVPLNLKGRSTLCF